MKEDYTEEWRNYQAGIDYNTRLDYYPKVDLNWNFYNSKQWLGIVTNGLSRWTFNIVRSAINYFISFITSQKLKMKYSAANIPDEPEDSGEQQIKEIVALLSDMADMKWEKDKMDHKLKDAMLDGANSGDIALHVYWDANIKTGQDEQGDFTTELVDGGNVMFGNPNNKIVEKQPYILLVGREMVSDLKTEAKANGISKEDIESITSDEENTYQTGERGKIELDSKGDSGKALTLIKYWKENGTVFWNKSTKYCPVVKKRDLGISRYPIAWANWESIKNSYHGMSAAEGIIDNQISINHLFAMVSYWMRMAAFGKVIYDGTKIEKWSNQLGTAIEAQGDVTGIVMQLQAGNFNGTVLTVIDMAIKYTKDFIGANDTLMGQVDPEQASGVAIVSTAKQASMPLINITMNRDQLVEDLGLIWGEFFLKKYVNRKVSVRRNGKVEVVPYQSDLIKDTLLQCKVDVGPSTYWSEIAGIQALDRLLDGGHITKLQYFERLAKMNIIPDCQGLIEDAKAEMEQAMAMEQQNAQYEQMAQWLESQPLEVQQQINMLQGPEKEQAIMQMMQQTRGTM